MFTIATTPGREADGLVAHVDTILLNKSTQQLHWIHADDTTALNKPTN